MVVIGTTVPCLHPLAFNFPNRKVQFCNQSPFRLILPPYSFVFKKRITMLSVGPPFLPSTAHFFCSVSSDIPQKAILLMAQMTLSCPVRLRDRLLGPPPLRVRPGGLLCGAVRSGPLSPHGTLARLLRDTVLLTLLLPLPSLFFTWFSSSFPTSCGTGVFWVNLMTLSSS